MNRKTLLCMALLASGALPALAQEEAAELSPIQVTAGRQAETTAAATSAVAISRAEDWAWERPGTLPTLLQNLPGVFVQQTTPGQGIAIVRGLKGSEVLHLVDGMRLNFAFFRNAPNQYLALVDPFGLQAAEVVRGPLASLYGADAMGGVINLRTVDAEIGAEQSWHSEVAARYASADLSQSTQGRVSYSSEQFGLSLGASYRDHGQRRTGAEDRLPFTEYTTRAADLKLAYQANAKQLWKLSLQSARQPSTPRHDQLVAGFGQSEPRRAEFAFEPSQRDFAHLSASWDDLAAGLDQFELNLAWQRFIDDTRRRSLGSSNRDLEENRSNLYGITLDARDQLSPEHGIHYGLEAYIDRVDSEKRRFNIDTGEVSDRESRFPDESEMRTLAAYVQHDWQIGPNRWDMGLRYTDVTVELEADGSRPRSRLQLDDMSGNLSWRRQLGRGLSLHSNLGRGFRSPNIFDLGALGSRPDNRFNQPNRDLDTEIVYSADLGLKFDSRRWRGEVFVWWADYRDKIVSVFTGEQTAAGEDIVRSENVGRVLLRGAETSLSWYFAPRWRLDLIANTTWGAEESNGRRQPADRIPPATATLRLQRSSKSGNRYRLEVSSAGSQERLSDRDRRDSRIRPEGSPGWARVGVGAQIQLGRSMDLELGLANLFDTQYRPHASGLDAPGIDAQVGLRWHY